MRICPSRPDQDGFCVPANIALQERRQSILHVPLLRDQVQVVEASGLVYKRLERFEWGGRRNVYCRNWRIQLTSFVVGVLSVSAVEAGSQ